MIINNGSMMNAISARFLGKLGSLGCYLSVEKNTIFGHTVGVPCFPGNWSKPSSSHGSKRHREIFIAVFGVPANTSSLDGETCVCELEERESSGDPSLGPSCTGSNTLLSHTAPLHTLTDPQSGTPTSLLFILHSTLPFEQRLLFCYTFNLPYMIIDVIT